MGGHHHVGGVLVQQAVQPAQQVVPPAVPRIVDGQVVVEVVEHPAIGHQHIKPPVHGGGAVGQSVFEQIHGVGPVARLPQLLLECLGGGKVAHAKLAGYNQNPHLGFPPQIST